jgi:hypothetical protein
MLSGLLGVGCAAVPLPCDISIAALPPDSNIQAGDALPPNLLVLASPGDFDPAGTGITADVNGGAAVNLELQGPAIARMAAHTADHTGESMAIAINGRVISVPMIGETLPDGKIQIATGGVGDTDLVERFAGCVR